MSSNLKIFEVKVKISMLWVLLGINLTIDFTLKELDQGSTGLVQRINTIPAQQLSLILVGDVFIRLIPFVFAFLSVALNDTWNRRMNLINSLISILLVFFGFVLLLLHLTNSTVYDIVIQIVAIFVPILIFWYSYKWPKEEINK